MTDKPGNPPIDDGPSALEQVSSWLSSLGVKIEKNRLSTYRRAFRAIDVHVRAGTLEKIGNELSPNEAANAFHEFGEIFHVWRGLKSLDDPILRQKLAKVVTGPPMLSQERPETSEPRNTLFELVIAAHLSLCGIKVVFRDPDDIVARVLHTPLLIECKRIQSTARFKDQFNKARRQLVRNLANEVSPGSKGLIAIDISKTQNTGASVLKTESTAKVRGMLIRRANQFRWQRMNLFQDQIDEAILGVIVYLRAPWVTGSEVMAALNSQFVQLIPLNQNVDRNKRIFETLVSYMTRLDPNMTRLV
jgi:hypothetical protein